MQNREPYTNDRSSPLVRLFVERCGTGARSPRLAMVDLAERLRRGHLKSRRGREQLEDYLGDRNITQLVFDPELQCDGMILPFGTSFTDGFRMTLKPNINGARVRFTMAHELCHTFFYELVPEIKFVASGHDEQEERLCDFGAAALLMPEAELRRQAKRLSKTLE